MWTGGRVRTFLDGRAAIRAVSGGTTEPETTKTGG